MANKKIAELIANGFRRGLVHPGRDGGPPAPIVLPMFRTEGLPPEMADLVAATADLIGEALVALIEGEGDAQIIDNPDLIQMRVATDENSPQRQVALHCRCDERRTDPLAVLTVTNSPYVIVPGKQLIAGLAGRNPNCPHERKS